MQFSADVKNEALCSEVCIPIAIVQILISNILSYQIFANQSFTIYTHTRARTHIHTYSLSLSTKFRNIMKSPSCRILTSEEYSTCKTPQKCTTASTKNAKIHMKIVEM